MQHEILALDIAGTPVRWVGAETAAAYYVSGKVAWELGDKPIHLRGGHNAHGLQSELFIAPIVAVRGPEYAVRKWAGEPRVSHRLLFARDRHMCAYCGQVFAHADLSMDHIVPVSRDGRDTWGNLVAACKRCNQAKANRTPEEARMPLLYVPYTPNRYEEFLVRGRRVIADQMAFLMAGVPRHSRLG